VYQRDNHIQIKTQQMKMTLPERLSRQGLDFGEVGENYIMQVLQYTQVIWN
jgi:hypothetical protein